MEAENKPAASREQVLYDAASYTADTVDAAEKAYVNERAHLADATPAGIAEARQRNALASVLSAVEGRVEAAGGRAVAEGAALPALADGPSACTEGVARIVDEDGLLAFQAGDGSRGKLKARIDRGVVDLSVASALAAQGRAAELPMASWRAGSAGAFLLSGRLAGRSLEATIAPGGAGGWDGSVLERAGSSQHLVAQVSALSSRDDAARWAEGRLWERGLSVDDASPTPSALDVERADAAIYDESMPAPALQATSRAFFMRASGLPDADGRAVIAVRREDGTVAYGRTLVQAAIDRRSQDRIARIVDRDGRAFALIDGPAGRVERELRIAPAEGAAWDECSLPALLAYLGTKKSLTQWTLGANPATLELKGAAPGDPCAILAEGAEAPGTWTVSVAREGSELGAARALSLEEEARQDAEARVFAAGGTIAEGSSQEFGRAMRLRESAMAGSLADFARALPRGGQALFADWDIASGGKDPELSTAVDAAGALGPLSAYASATPASLRTESSTPAAHSVRAAAGGAGIAGAGQLYAVRAASLDDCIELLASGPRRCAVLYRDLAFAPAGDGAFSVMKADETGAFSVFEEGWRPGIFALDKVAAAADISQMELASPHMCAQGRWAAAGAWLAQAVSRTLGSAPDGKLATRAVADVRASGRLRPLAEECCARTWRVAADCTARLSRPQRGPLLRTWRPLVASWAKQANVQVDAEQQEEIARQLAYELACRNEQQARFAQRELARRNLLPIIEARRPEGDERRCWEVQPANQQQRSAQVRREADERFTTTLAAALGITTAVGVVGALVEDRAAALMAAGGTSISGGGPGALALERAMEVPLPSIGMAR